MSEWKPIYYVHFDPETRELLGGYFQELVLPDHKYHLVVSHQVQQMWPMYMLNENMTGLLLDPRWQPGYVDPDRLDPGTEPPVQSEPPTNP